MVIYLKASAGIISAITFQTYGCPGAICCGSAVTELVKGHAFKDAQAIDAPRILDFLGGLPLGKRHCAGLAVSALRNALGRLPS
jgi:nitrogen fixation NifU-like protein